MGWKKTVAVAVSAALTFCGVAQADTTLRFSPVADTKVDSSQPTTGFGTSTSLNADASPTIRSFLRFPVYGVTGRPFAAAGLRMRNVDSSNNGGRVSSMSSHSWSESVTWESQPAIDGPQLGAFGAVLAGKDYFTSLSDAVAVDGPVDVALDSTSGDGAGWGSRESSTPPELAITLAEDTGLSQPAGPRVGSSDPTYFASNHRLAVTAGGRVLTVHGRHADGVQLAWRDAGSDWRNATRGTTADGRLLSGTGTGDWPASVVVGRDSAGVEHAWVVWSGRYFGSLRPVKMARLTDLDSPDGPLVEQITTVDSPPQGATRADVAIETLPSGERRGSLLWSRRVESGNYEIVASTFDLADPTSAPTMPRVLVSDPSDRRYGTLVNTSNGIRAAIRGRSSRLQLYGQVDGAWTALGSGATIASASLPDAPSAAALPNGDVLVASALDAGAGTIAVQRFSPGSTTATTQLQLTGYSEPTVVADRGRAWLVSIRRSDGAVVSRELGPDGWSSIDRTEMLAGGNHQWPGALAADGRLRLLVRGPAGSTDRSAVLAFDRTQGKTDQSIIFDAPSGRTYGDLDVEPATTASSGLPVSYASSTPRVCTIVTDPADNKQKVHIIAAGGCTVTASQGGNADYNPAPDVQRTFAIAKKELEGAFTADDKTYDGNRDATIASRSVTGELSGENVDLTGASAAFDTKDVGTGKDVTATGFELSGTDKGNYSLKSSTLTTKADIAKKALTLNGAAPTNKVYDGNKAATVDFGGASPAGLVTGDDVSLRHSGYAAEFDDKNVGTDKPVAVTRIALDGADASNYSISETTALKADITKAALEVNAKNVTATYRDDPQLDYSLSGFENSEDEQSANLTGKADCSVAYGTSTDVGDYPDAIACSVGDLEAANYSFTEGSRSNLTIVKANTTLAYTGDTSKQYSDKAHFTATLKEGSTSLADKTVEFKVGTQNTEATTDENGVVSFDLKVDQALGTPTVAASFAGDRNHTGASDSKTFTISAEDARASYTGSMFNSTASTTSSAATVGLAATIRDITAVTEDPAHDSSEGDVRHATVTFVNRESSNAPLCSSSVVLVSSADTKTGTAKCDWKADIGAVDGKQFTVGVKVNGRYVRDASTDDSVVTVSKPLTSFITGGGYLVNKESAGLKAGEAGKRTNFGFHVKYSKSNTNPQGNINIIVRSGSKVFQIKGNSMTSLSTKPTTIGGASTFKGKASIQDITEPGNPVPVDTGTLQITMTDNGQPGSSDTIGLTIWNTSGGMWFSSNWSSTKTLEQLLAGGNLVLAR